MPTSVPAYTVGMVCGSGMKSVIEGARSILAGDADIIVAGGTENMSAAPYALPAARWGARMGDNKMMDTMIKDGLWDAYNNYHMGTTAENICDVWGITREELDEFAASSQNKAEAAINSGRFNDEIVPVMIKKKKETVEFKVDEFPRAGVTAEGISKLRGAFPVGPEGVEDEIVHTFEPTQIHEADAKKHVQRVTAANASGINDGAAAIILASGEAVEKYGLKPMAKLISWGQGGVDPKIMGVGPVPASRQAMEPSPWVTPWVLPVPVSSSPCSTRCRSVPRPRRALPPCVSAAVWALPPSLRSADLIYKNSAPTGALFSSSAKRKDNWNIPKRNRNPRRPLQGAGVFC